MIDVYNSIERNYFSDCSLQCIKRNKNGAFVDGWTWSSTNGKFELISFIFLLTRSFLDEISIDYDLQNGIAYLTFTFLISI